MIKDIVFLFHAAKNIEFVEGEFRPANAGKMTFNTNRHVEFELTEINKDGKSTLHLKDTVDVTLNGLNVIDGEDDELAFSLKATIELIYQAPSDLKEAVKDERFISDNVWFFDNFSHICCHQLASSVLEQTRFSGVLSLVPLVRRDDIKS